MTIKQISVFIENTPGRICEVMGILADANINASAMAIADASDYGMMRLIVSDPDKAYALLKEAGFSVTKNHVLCCKVPDTPGGLRRILTYLAEENISIEYMYAFSIGPDASIIIRPEDCEKAKEVLLKHKMELVCTSEIYKFE